MSDLKGNNPKVYEMPDMLGRCHGCGEWTNAYNPCCGSACTVEGSTTWSEDLISDWEQETGLSWEIVFNG